MENQFFVDSEYLSPEALSRKHRLETDPASRTDHMADLPGMERIQSDVMDKVMAQMGAAAIMANTALATAGDLPRMAAAFRQAIEAGRKAYLSGLGRVLARGASASDPLTGFLRD